MFFKAVEYIRAHDYERRFYKQTKLYFDDGKYNYWTMGDPIDKTEVVNHCLKGDAYEKRLAKGSLPQQKSRGKYERKLDTCSSKLSSLNLNRSFGSRQ